MLVRHSTAQHRVRSVEAADRGGDGVAAGQADGGIGEFEPPVGLVGDQRAEAEGACEGEVGGVEAGHHVAGAAPAVDGLGGIADHNELRVVALGGEDLFQDGVGVLGLVQEQEVGADARLGQGQHLQVVVVFEADCSLCGVV